MDLQLVPHFFAEIFGENSGVLVAILVPIAVLVCGAAIAISGMYFNHRRQALWHELARLAIEKGQPLPPQPQKEEKSLAEKRRDETRDDFRTGLILVAAGVGLWLFLGTFIRRELGYVGAVPGFVGVALLIHGLLSVTFGRKQ
jgi:hypothetical protein